MRETEHEVKYLLNINKYNNKVGKQKVSLSIIMLRIMQKNNINLEMA